MLKKYPLALYLVWLIALLLFPAPLVLSLNLGMGAGNTPQLIWIDCGVIAYAWWLFEVFLATRPTWLDRLIGLPALYFVHGLLGVDALLIAFVHRNFLISMGAQIRLTGKVAWYLALFGIIYASLFMSGWLVDRLPVIARVKTKLQFFFKHRLSLWIHRLNLVAILLIWLHVHLIGRVNHQLVFMLLFDGYTVLILSAYLWQKWVAPTQRRTGQVLATQRLNERTVLITLVFRGARQLFQAGDFFFFTFDGISREAHPFSVVNQADAAGEQIQILVRSVGDDTRKLQQVAVGTVVQVEGPFGRFAAIVEQDRRPLVLIGLGSGLAPLLSLARTYLGTRSIQVIWTVKNDRDRYFVTDLAALVDPQFSYFIQNGRLRSEQLSTMISPEKLAQARFLIVGPASAVLSIRKMLRQAGVPRDHLTDERLTM